MFRDSRWQGAGVGPPVGRVRPVRVVVGVVVSGLVTVLSAAAETPQLSDVPSRRASLLRDINRTVGRDQGSKPTGMIRLGKYVYFAASDPEHGNELWRISLEGDGAELVRDIFPGPHSGLFQEWFQRGSRYAHHAHVDPPADSAAVVVSNRFASAGSA